MPTHDFHTSWMTFRYQEAERHFEVSWRTDTEHFESVIGNELGRDVVFEPDSIEQYEGVIERYMQEHCKFKLNKKAQKLRIDVIEVNFSEITLHFKPIEWCRRLKQIEMENGLLIEQFPNQSNMVQFFYKGETFSMLFNKAEVEHQVEVK